VEHFILAQIGIEGALSVLKAILYFIITIFILVTVHEFGHFIAGRIFGMRVPVFSVGMGRRLFGFNKVNGLTVGPLAAETEIQLADHTDYRLSLLPIGGYAKIEGMIDETQNEALPDEIQPWEFRAKPWWQKSIVICAGVIMNTILALIIFSGHNYVSGADLIMTTTIGYVGTGSMSHQLGVKPNDKIVAIDGKPRSRERRGAERAAIGAGERSMQPVGVPLQRLRSRGQVVRERRWLGRLCVRVPRHERAQVFADQPHKRGA